MTVRTRELPYKVKYAYGQSFGSNIGGGTSTWRGRQETVSEGHRKGRDGRYREGGPFYTYRTDVNVPTTYVNLRNTRLNPTKSYSGPAHVSLVPTSAGGGHPVPNPDSSYLDPIGAQAISSINPSNPNAEAGVALGEIVKDRSIPTPAIQAWRGRTLAAKTAGGEYLNAVFGWLPLVKDMKNVAQSVLDGNTIMENYQNASGTLVHREFAFPDIEETEPEVVVGNTIPSYGYSAGDFNNGNKPVTRSRIKTTRRWFSGTFTYLAQQDQSSVAKCLGYGSQAEKLFGLSLTPDLVWELTPWSWAIDWFSNAGAVIHNIGAMKAAGLVMSYGYIMEETSTVDTYRMPNDCFKSEGKVISVPLPPATVTTTVKRRAEANPFGFGLKWDGLSPTQLAITAALGITRLR